MQLGELSFERRGEVCVGGCAFDTSAQEGKKSSYLTARVHLLCLKMLWCREKQPTTVFLPRIASFLSSPSADRAGLMCEFLPALWRRPGWRRSSLFQIGLRWRLASLGQPWPPSPAPRAAPAPASLLSTKRAGKKKIRTQATSKLSLAKSANKKNFRDEIVVIISNCIAFFSQRHKKEKAPKHGGYWCSHGWVGESSRGLYRWEKWLSHWVRHGTGSEWRFWKDLFTGVAVGEEAGRGVLDVLSLLMAFKDEPFWILGVMKIRIRDQQRKRWTMFLRLKKDNCNVTYYLM